VLPSYVLARLATLLADLQAPPDLQAQELDYLLANYHLVNVGAAELEQALAQLKAQPEPGIELHLLALAAQLGGCSHVLRCGPATMLRHIVFLPPEALLASVARPA
jgi:hypothetical protein